MTIYDETLPGKAVIMKLFNKDVIELKANVDDLIEKNGGPHRPNEVYECFDDLDAPSGTKIAKLKDIKGFYNYRLGEAIKHYQDMMVRCSEIADKPEDWFREKFSPININDERHANLKILIRIRWLQNQENTQESINIYTALISYMVNPLRVLINSCNPVDIEELVKNL